MRLENLEDRRLLAFQVIGVQPSSTELLQPGDVRTEELRDLVFRFNDTTQIDPATLSGIQLTRSGFDGQFERATATSDLNTGGGVTMQFAAANSGPSGEGIRIDFTEADLGAASGPTIGVNDRFVTVVLNTNAFSVTTAAQLRSAINTHPEANKLIIASIVGGNAFTPVVAGNLSYSPLILSGANAASATTNFGVSQAEVLFTSVASGVQGNGIELRFFSADQGGAGSPVIVTSAVDRRIDITLNTNSGNETTAQQLVSAINNDTDANQLIRATLTVGDGATNISGNTVPSLILSGANDVPIEPGYVGVGDFSNEVVVRFAESLPDDTYRIDIFADDNPVKTSLRNTDGEPYNDGVDTQFTFELDLGAQVVSVIPQPTSRTVNGLIEQALDQVHVYFNEDPLNESSAESPDFYQLLFTQDTARNTDDLVFQPTSVDYDASQHRAVLTFASDLHLLAGSAGTFRLRIGTDETVPLAPNQVTPAADPGSSFATALDVTADFDTGPVLTIGDGTTFTDGDLLTIADDLGNVVTFEFEDAINGPIGVGANREAIVFNVTFSEILMTQIIATAIRDAVNNTPGFNVTPTERGNELLLANDTSVELQFANGGIRKASQGAIFNEMITNAGQSFGLNLPGASTEPGHRDDTALQSHLAAGPDSIDGVQTVFYNFQDNYGFKNGLPLHNAITEAQKDRAREIFQIYSDLLGIQFIETAAEGVTIVTGDLAPLNLISGFGGVLGVATTANLTSGLAIMDQIDFTSLGDDEQGGSWFQTALHEIGHLLGLGHSYELPPGTVQGDEPSLSFGHVNEPVFPGDHDIVHGQFLHRPESKDIDLYRFEVTETGLFSAETFAEREVDPSLLNTNLALFREDTSTGERTKIAQNDDYYSNDSFIELDLTAGVYYLGVTASGNDQYDPTIEDTGFGGTTEGDYELRMNFRPDADSSIVDADNETAVGVTALAASTPLDGDSDGVPGGVFNFWFRAAAPSNGPAAGTSRVVYVDKAAQPGGNGMMTTPFRNLDDALNPANPNSVKDGDILRIVGNAGPDGDITTLADNMAYQIGFSGLNGIVLEDGATFDVPKGVAVQIDAGAIFKLRNARIGVGSSSPNIDRSGGSLQVFGAPRLFDGAGDIIRNSLGQPLIASAYFTTIHNTDIGSDTNPDNTPPAASAGDWGGIDFRGAIDKADRNRFDYEQEAIFVNSIYYADISFGGGTVSVDGLPQVVTSIRLDESRPTIANNFIHDGADAAVSADPNSFEESNFHSSEFQLSGAFSSDFIRSGPDFDGNMMMDNSINGLFVRIDTPAGQALEPLTVSSRWDDDDIVHIIKENVVVRGQPGGPVSTDVAPPSVLVAATSVVAPGSTADLLVGNAYNYRIVFVDNLGNEGPPSNSTSEVELLAGHNAVRLDNLPPIDPTSSFVSRRIYRSDPFAPGDGPTYAGPYHLVANINANDTVFVDDTASLGGLLTEFQRELRARLNARLRVDAGVVVKSQAAIIDVQMGGQFISEGNAGQNAVFTSLLDNRFGAGGTFESSDLSASLAAARGDWGGVVGNLGGNISIDNSVFAFGGGETRVSGEFRGFNVLEINQGDGRVTNSTFEFNADGTASNSGTGDTRFGRGFNESATIFVRGAQPIIIGNTVTNNDGPVISINANALNHTNVEDVGRSTGPIDLIEGRPGNHGPLVMDNRIDQNSTNGMVIRGQTLTTQSVWDDTDITHVLLDSIEVPDFHTYGGLRLQSSASESLVVKLDGADAGFAATGRPLDIEDRIGGTLQIVGQPGQPVVLTALGDDTVGSGFQPDGSPQVDTNNDGVFGEDDQPPLPTGPEVNNGLLIDNDVPTNIVGHFEATPTNGGNISFNSGVTVQGLNSLAVNANFIFDFVNFADVGSNGSAIDLSTSTITQAPTLVADDVVESRGSFAGANGTVNWTARTSFQDGVAVLFNEITFDSTEAFGDLRFINYLDEDVQGILDDILYPTGTPGAADFRAFTLDNPERFGFSHGGFYQPGAELINATYDGWAADEFADLLTIIGGGGTTYSIPGNIDQTSLPPLIDPTLGQVYGPADVTTAFAWTLDPDASTATVTAFLELISGNSVVGAPDFTGAWGSVLIDQWANDRNVELATELEAGDITAPGPNGTPTSPEFLGSLAPNQKSGDENLRLGFEVHGLLSEPADVDVYSFDAEAGTEVWLDIDRTTMSLDTVVELVDANGTMLARSVNSAAEAADPQLLRDALPAATPLPDNHVNPLAKSQFNGVDNYTSNPRDAGMRLVLHGTPGQRNTYYVRVRSNSADLSNLAGGLTSGVYQLQVRLQETDEVPGSTVRFSDVRFSTDGIQVHGHPSHSFLGGEAGEPVDNFGFDTNDTSQTAVDLGNLLNTNGSALAVAGSIGSPFDPDAAHDADWYRIDLQYDSTQSSSQRVTPTSAFHAGVTFDVDYSDGLGHGNLNLYVFDADPATLQPRNLILVGRDSNIPDDLPGALEQLDADDLARGSFGALDPFIGTVMLPARGATTGPSSGAGTFYIAITSTAKQLVQLDQYNTANPDNPLLRLEPVNSLNRIVEDHIDGGITDRGSNIALPAVVPDFLHANSEVPYFLNDVSLFVSVDAGIDRSNLHLVDPFTGAQEGQVGRFPMDVGDIEFQAAGGGNLFAFTTPETGANDANTGNYLRIDPRSLTTTNLATNLGDDGIDTFINDPANPGTAIKPNNTQGVGIHFNAIDYANFGFGVSGWGVGNRGDISGDPLNDSPWSQNNLYEFVPATGVAISRGGRGDRQDSDNPFERRYFGAGTDIRERGRLNTSADPLSLGRFVLITSEATFSDPQGSTRLITDGATAPVTFSIDTDGDMISDFFFEFNAGPEVDVVHSPPTGVTIRDGDTFTLDGIPYEFDTGSVLVVTATDLPQQPAGRLFNDGETITITDDSVNTVVFEFNDTDAPGPPPQGGRVLINFRKNFNQAQMITAVINAINNSPETNVQAELLASTNRITLHNESPTIAATETTSGMIVDGAPGGAGFTIPVEEVMDLGEFGSAIETAFQAFPVNASIDGSRLNFRGALVGDFSQMELNRPGVFTTVAADGLVQPGFLPVDFDADDDEDDIAARIVTAAQGVGLNVTQLGGAVSFADGSLPFLEIRTVDPPLQVGGDAPGGNITGIADLGGRLWAVSDRGGLFEIIDPTSPVEGAFTDYIDSALDLRFGGPGGAAIQFAGLTRFPAATEASFESAADYSDKLLGIDVNGRLYAFDTTGALQPLLLDGNSSMDTGLGGVQGLAFSNLAANPWRNTTDRTGAGHGVEPIFDGSRTTQVGPNTNFRFGPYDFAGGAHGVLESEPFSLKGYSSHDFPMLYYSYYLDTENTNAASPGSGELMRDSFRVYVAGEDGIWHLLTTNNSDRAGLDEFDDEDFVTGIFDNIVNDVQENFDVGDNGAPDSWRQVRVPLAAFAGQENLRLRFEFSTAGDIDAGNANTVGQQLRALVASDLRDGQTFTVTDDAGFFGTQTVFELDLGITFVTPSPAAIEDGDTFTIHGQVFEFDSVGGLNDANATSIPFDAMTSPADLATVIAGILNGVDYTYTADLTVEPNDTMRADTNDIDHKAIDTGLLGGSDRFMASGVIGDNPELSINLAADVDLLQLDLNQGDVVTFDVDAATIGSGLDARLRLFDASGVELATNDTDGVTSDAFLNFTAPATGRYILGVSDGQNDAYSPMTQQSGTGLTTGAYDITIVINGFAGVTPHVNAHRLNLEGAEKADRTVVGGGQLLPAGTFEGSLGTTTVAPTVVGVPLNAGMTDVEVKEQLAIALADHYAGGVRSAVKTYGAVVMMLGHNVVEQDLGAFGIKQLGLSNPFNGFANADHMGDAFGDHSASTSFTGTTSTALPGSKRSQDNAHEGVYLDDIIIGFAERGETVEGGTANDSFLDLPVTQASEGTYTLEVRTSELYGPSTSPPLPTLLLDPIFGGRSFDSNDRIAQGVSIVAPFGYEVVEGSTFTISDGIDTVTFEYDDTAINDGVAPGNVEVPFLPSQSNSLIARTIATAINRDESQAVLDVTAGMSEGAQQSSRTSSLPPSSSPIVNLYGETVLVDGIGNLGATAIPESNNDVIGPPAFDTGLMLTGDATSNGVFVGNGDIGDRADISPGDDVDLFKLELDTGDRYEFEIVAANAGSGLDPILRLFDAFGTQVAVNDDTNGLDSFIDYTAVADGTYYLGVSSFANFGYDPAVDASGSGFSAGFYTLTIQPFGTTAPTSTVLEFDDSGDHNRQRQQGQVLIHSNVIRSALNFGIDIDAGPRSQPALSTLAGDLPHPGAVRNTDQINTSGLLPGVVVENNVVYDSGGGISFSGESIDSTGPAPYGRIVNNTLHRNAVGIEVSENASPSVLNNVLSRNTIGLDIDGSSSTTVVGGNLFRVNVTNSTTTVGSNSIVITDPNLELFINETRGNFYLAPGVPGIDSSIDQMNDRAAIVQVKAPLGIASSPILAPEFDVFGQLRTDDPDSPNQNGSGRDVFADRGAVDRADFAGPSATLVDPRDNDADGLDTNLSPNAVETAAVLDGFSIQLLDTASLVNPTNGVGIDDFTVTKNQVIVFRDGVRLVEGVDYRFRYSATNNTIRLTPVAGIWEPNHSYLIQLANDDVFVVSAPAGDDVIDGQTFSVTDTTGQTVNFEFESGYSAVVAETLSIQVPTEGGGLGGVTDRETFTIADGTGTTTFEFDNNGNVAAGNVPLVFTPISTAVEIAQSIVDAIIAADIGASPVNLGAGLVHVGVDATHGVNVSSAPSLTTSGTETGGVRDGDSFTIDDGTQILTYEFDRGDGLVNAGATTIDVTLADTYERIADKIVAAITAYSVALSPTHFGGGVIHLGGARLHVIDMTNSNVVLSGQPGVNPSFGIRVPSAAGLPLGIDDGETFRLGDGAQLPVVFEFDSDGVVVPGNSVVSFTANSTLADIANSVVTAISNVGLGLNPTNVGDGFINLANSTANHFFDAQTSSLLQLGAPGTAGAVPVNYLPTDTFTDAQMAVVITAAINSSSLDSVIATARGNEIVLAGVTDVNGIIEVFVEGVRDLAGNVLQANQSNGETSFTIAIGEGVDFGDAPASFPVSLAENGARHTIDSDFTIGVIADVDVDGVHSDSIADDLTGSDDEDGVSFSTVGGATGFLTPSYDGQMDVVINGVSGSQPGFIDAWIDFNGNGVWEFSEQVANTMPVVNGVNPVNFAVPTTAFLGEVHSRVRLSSTGGLGVTGAADDGEVEDTPVRIVQGPWHNAALFADVSGEGNLTAMDILRIVHVLAHGGTNVALPVDGVLVLPNTTINAGAGFMVDANNSGRATLADALMVVFEVANALNSGNPEGEGLLGEGEGGGLGFRQTLTSTTTSGNFLAPNSVQVAAPETATQRDRRDEFEPVEVEFRLPPRDVSAGVDVWAKDERNASFESVLDEIVGDVGDVIISDDPRDDVFARLDG
ncbi:MAG: pre-peptidase C-terminal domain-containing protein [Pirellulaceae bacterium]|nr:pre-peptidase C-terminal domain-containing protein [Pirellulaceae bacterium]